MGLASLKQGSMPSTDFAREFEHRALDANMTEAEAKSAMLQALAPQTLERLDLFIQSRTTETMPHEGGIERLARISYRDIHGFLRQSHVSDIAAKGSGCTRLT